MLPDGQPVIVVLTILAQIYSIKLKETELSATLYQNGEGRTTNYLDATARFIFA